MKKTNSMFVGLMLAAAMLSGSGAIFSVHSQNPAPSPALTSEQQAAKDKDKWSKALNEALRDFQNSNDRESAGFAGEILASLDQPGGLSPTSLATDLERMNDRVRELVRKGALESAATLQVAAYHVPQLRKNSSGPAHPNRKTGGTPGPGGLVLYLPFDQPDDGGVIHDKSGTGNDGRVFGAKWVSEGKFGGAYRFHITNLTDRIIIPNSDTLNPDYITLSAWIKTAERDGFWKRIMDKDYNTYCFDLGGDDINKTARGKLQFETSAGAMGADRALDDNQWHHVAATYDGKTLRSYTDGVEKSRSPSKPGPLKRNDWDLCIGNSVADYGTGEFLAFDGLIDEVRIYNRALSADEIKSLANATEAKVDVAPAPPADNSGKPAAAERLKQVKSLFDQGLINKDDYDKKVKEIMDSL